MARYTRRQFVAQLFAASIGPASSTLPGPFISGDWNAGLAELFVLTRQPGSSSVIIDIWTSQIGSLDLALLPEQLGRAVLWHDVRGATGLARSISEIISASEECFGIKPVLGSNAAAVIASVEFQSSFEILLNSFAPALLKTIGRRIAVIDLSSCGLTRLQWLDVIPLLRSLYTHIVGVDYSVPGLCELYHKLEPQHRLSNLARRTLQVCDYWLLASDQSISGRVELSSEERSLAFTTSLGHLGLALVCPGADICNAVQSVAHGSVRCVWSEQVSPSIKAPSTPGAELRLVPDWVKHSYCWMAWAFHREWGSLLHSAKKELRDLIIVISRYERVRLLTPPHAIQEAQSLFSDNNVEVVTAPVDDIWMRDIAPIYVMLDGDAVPIDLNFNSWGNSEYREARPGDRLAAVAGPLFGSQTLSAPFVAEGGAFTVDEDGFVYTTKSCLLSESRNPIIQQTDIERGLIQLGASKVVWLEGDFDEMITNGHVDGYVLPTETGEVLVQTAPHGGDKATRAADIDRIQSVLDQKGTGASVHLVSPPDHLPRREQMFAGSYMNVYTPNGAVIMPIFGDSQRDAEAERAIRAGFPTREVHTVTINSIASGGGGVRCLVQPVPSDANSTRRRAKKKVGEGMTRKRITSEFFDDHVEFVARALIGADIYTNVAGARVGGKIVSTESYGPGDPFSHSYRGPGADVKPGANQMSEPAGRIYFAQNGQGCTFNISCGPAGYSSAVLICVLRPFCGSTAVMRARRIRPVGYSDDLKSYNRLLDDPEKYLSVLCDGPLTLCDALGIDNELYKLSHVGKLSIDSSYFELFAPDKTYPVATDSREGLKEMRKRLRAERAAHPDIDFHQSAQRRFILEGIDNLPPCLPDPD